MLKIGAFAQLAGVSVRTVRHYEQVGLLTPDRVDAATGYRWFRATQLPRLHRILALKDLGLSLEQLRPLLTEVSAADLRAMLVEKREDLHDELNERRTRLDRVEQRLRYIELEAMMTIDVLVKEIPALRVAQIRGKDGVTFHDVGSFAAEAGAELLERLEQAGVEISGTGFVHYQPVGDEQVVPTVAAPIDAGWYVGDDLVEVTTLDAVRVVSTTYHGDEGHGAIGPLYGQLARFAEDHGFDVLGPGRDHLIEFTELGVLVELQLPVTARS